ncbi:MAG TPA: isoamylase [Thermoanaerobaculia bacterium]|nr:isoamylase [Thermoanaerobaculia bacterium]
MAPSGGGAVAADLALRPGSPQPPGASRTADGVQFALVAPGATAVWLVLWPQGRRGERHDLALRTAGNRSGDVWHVEVLGVAAPLEWGWRVERPAAAAGPPPDPGRLLLDPYARAISGAERWGVPAKERRCVMVGEAGPADPGAGSSPDLRRRGGACPRPQRPLQDQVIYELCVRGFTAHPSSGVASRGTFRGLLEKVPYLVELGVTTVELLPVTEWDELEVGRHDPATGELLRNLWGYSPLAFSAPKAGLAAAGDAAGVLAELRELVDALHGAGIAVVLDLVFNHTGEKEGRPHDPVFSFGGIAPATYYLLDPARGRYRDLTGCGNTVACNHAAVNDLIVDALRWWAAEVGADGFRFDLAAVLARGEGGEPLARPPLIDRIAGDPLLAGCDLIAEPWDAAGFYLGGAFARHGGRPWAEWNDRFRDDVRRFVRGEPGLTGALAARLAGSRDRFAGGPLGPAHAINYVACHDGFTLADLVCCDHKHNERNGEGNRDGADWNASWSCGVEGPTDHPAVLALRRRQMRNLLTLLFLAQGVPMLLAGDERGRSQEGNNNAWCHDDELGWLDWSRDDAGLRRFTRGLIAFRRAHPALRRETFLGGEGTTGSGRPDVSWHSARVGHPDWGPGARLLAMHLAGEHAPSPDDDLYLAANAATEEVTCELPAPPAGRRWLRVVATWEPAPNDLLLPGEEELVAGERVALPGHSCVVLRSG